jgi:hypothetical protein
VISPHLPVNWGFRCLFLIVLDKRPTVICHVGANDSLIDAPFRAMPAGTPRLSPFVPIFPVSKVIPMIHARPPIKIHPDQSATIPAFAKSHASGAAATPHRLSGPPSGSILTTVITHAQIAERAYDIFVQSGRHEGQCQRNWEQAEKDLRDQGLLACHSEHVRAGVFAPDAIEAP